MKLYGLQANSNPIVLEVFAAEIDIFDSSIMFTAYNGDRWKLHFENINEAKIMLAELFEHDNYRLEVRNNPRYMLTKIEEKEIMGNVTKRETRRGLAC